MGVVGGLRRLAGFLAAGSSQIDFAAQGGNLFDGLGEDVRSLAFADVGYPAETYFTFLLSREMHTTRNGGRRLAKMTAASESRQRPGDGGVGLKDCA